MKYFKLKNLSLLTTILFSVIFSYSGMYFPEGLYIGGEYSTANFRDEEGNKFSENDEGIEVSYLFPGRMFEILLSYNNEYIEYDDPQLSADEASAPITGIDGAFYVINDNNAMRLMINVGYSFGSFESDYIDQLESLGADVDNSISRQQIGTRFFGSIPLSNRSLRITPFFGYNFIKLKMKSEIIFQGSIDTEDNTEDGSETVFGCGITFGRLLIEPSVTRSDGSDYYYMKVGLKL